ncbi:MAG TPA: DNRLRE domain-containing protein [Planctomycetota bacterium]
MSTLLALILQAGDPQLKTDHPHYPGEGAFSTPAKCLQAAWATPRGALGSGTPREKMIRLFLWRAETYAHLSSPAVYNLPGRTPKPTADDPLMIDYDAMRGLFSYGWGLCGTNHGQMRVFAEAAGWTDRRRGLQGDTGYEVFVDGGWRYFNTDQYTLHFLSNDPAAHFASVDQVVSTNHRYIEWNPDLGLGYRLPQANTHGQYQDFAGVTGTVANRSQQWRGYYTGVWNILPAASTKMYGEGYTATPVAVRLKRGETFTRWMAPGGAQTELGLAGPAWWGHDGAAPFAEHSFVQNAPARDEIPGGAEESDGNSRHGNVCFDWNPDLAAGEHLDGALAVNGTLTSGGAPKLAASGAANITFHQYTPYTIAGRPVGGLDPALASLDGAVLSANAVGTVAVELSVNAGATWTSIGSLAGAAASIDFTDAVKGRNQYLLRLSFDGGEGLNSLRLRTLGMMNQGVYPTLKNGSTSVTYTAGNAGAMELSPDLFTAASANSTSGYVQKVGDSGNLNPVHYGAGSTYAYQSTNNQPISTTWKILLPVAGAAWKRIHAAADYQVRVPPTGGPYGRIEISPDNATWTQIANTAPPADNELSHFWTYGDGAASGTTYYVRYTTYNGGYTAGIRYLRLSATYTTPASAVPVNVAYHWNNGAETSNTHAVAGASDTWTIATGTIAAQRKVVMSLGSAPAAPGAPTITTQPQSQTITQGQTATFTVAASGATSYQWKLNGVDIPGATSASHTASTAGTYTVVVTNASGSVTSSPATLTVNPAGGGGSPVTVALTAVEDTYLDQFLPTDNNGHLDRIDVRWYDAGAGLVEHMQTLLRFDLSSIPAGSTITAATLTLHNTRAAANGAGDVVSLGRVTTAWTEAHTWNMGVPSSVPTGIPMPSVAGLTQSPAAPEPYAIPGVETLVQGWVDAPASNLGMLIATANNLNLRFASSEHGTASARPRLDITYTSAAAPPPVVTPPPVTPPVVASSSRDNDNGDTCGCGSSIVSALPGAWLGLLLLLALTFARRP